MDLIQAYYMVAQHLQEQATRKAEIADMLAKMADRMTEAQQKQPAPTGTREP